MTRQTAALRTRLVGTPEKSTRHVQHSCLSSRRVVMEKLPLAAAGAESPVDVAPEDRKSARAASDAPSHFAALTCRPLSIRSARPLCHRSSRWSARRGSRAKAVGCGRFGSYPRPASLNSLSATANFYPLYDSSTASSRSW
jgi:hypothetical protein